MDTDNKSYLTTTAISFAVAISCVAVGLRLLARKVQRLALRADDYMILAGALFTIGNAVVYIYANQNGNGRHTDTLRPDQLVNYWKTFYASYQLYGLAITAIKISILLFYRRIFSTPQFRLWTNIVGVLVIAWLIAQNLVAVFQCNPVRKAWDLEIPGHCINQLNLIIAAHVCNIALDIVILALPMSAVYRLQMSRVKKISVAGIFLLGGLSIIIAIVRLVVVTTSGLDDLTYHTAKSNWTIVEPAIEVLSACLPVMAPLLDMQAVLADIQNFFRSLLSFHKPTTEDDSEASHKFRHLDRYDRTLVGEQRGQSTCTAAATPRESESGPDGFPLQSIVVKQDLYWREERK